MACLRKPTARRRRNRWEEWNLWGIGRPNCEDYRFRIILTCCICSDGEELYTIYRNALYFAKVDILESLFADDLLSKIVSIGNLLAMIAKE